MKIKTKKNFLLKTLIKFIIINKHNIDIKVYEFMSWLEIHIAKNKNYNYN
jgi:hypothetical protein